VRESLDIVEYYAYFITIWSILFYDVTEPRQNKKTSENTNPSNKKNPMIHDLGIATIEVAVSRTNLQ
ncbi:hypothetical protein SPOG_05717, partial [Schizosaccharomyces cryophilus OY26]